MLPEGGFSLLCVLSPFSSKTNLPQLSPLCDHKPWAHFPHSVGLLPGLQRGLAGMRHLAHSAASRNGYPWAGFTVMNLVSSCPFLCFYHCPHTPITRDSRHRRGCPILKTKPPFACSAMVSSDFTLGWEAEGWWVGEVLNRSWLDELFETVEDHGSSKSLRVVQ